MTDDILQLLAQQFQKAEQTNHELIIGHGSTETRITIALSDEMFTHSFGLEHIAGIQAEVQNRNQNRIDLFRDLIQHGRPISSFPVEEQRSITDSIPATYNPLTQTKCTIAERLDALLSFPDFMERLHEGKVYEFRPRSVFFESKTKNTNGRPLAKVKRDVSIQADFVIKMKMPTQNGPDEYNLFLCFAKQNENIKRFGSKRLCTCSVTLISAFADGVDITARQTQCKVLKHTILDKETREKTVPYQLPNYRPVDLPTTEAPAITTNVIHYQPPQLPRSDVLTANAVLPPSPKGFLDRLREFAANMAAKVRKAFRSFTKQEQAEAKRRPAEPTRSTKQTAHDHPQETAPRVPQQTAERKQFTISGAKRSAIAANAERAGHKEMPQQHREQAHKRDDDTLS